MAPRLGQAVRAVRAGGVIAYPTEAVYGLGCDPRDETAVRQILALKQRAPSKGLIVIAADINQLKPWLLPLSPEQLDTLHATWPGPVTWLLPAKPTVPYWLRGQHSTLAVRVTAHPVAAALCRRAGTALVSTSANISQRPPARSALTVRRYFGQRLDYVLAGPLGDADRPTEIRELFSGRVLRAG